MGRSDHLLPDALQRRPWLVDKPMWRSAGDDGEQRDTDAPARAASGVDPVPSTVWGDRVGIGGG